ncbi:factor arrest protein 3 [Monosporozyma servazzii]
MSTDNFEYLYQLTRNLSDESRTTRDETDKIELLLKRVAKQSSISYKQLSSVVKPETLQSYKNEKNEKDEVQQLIEDNYRLIYEIEQEEYLNKKFLLMIENIKEQLQSIKNYIIEIKLTREQDLENFLYENITSKSKIIESNVKELKLKNQLSDERIDTEVIGKFKVLYRELKANSLLQQHRSPSLIAALEDEIDEIEQLYNISLR